MNNYELTLILNPDLSSKFDEFQSKFEKTLTDINFKINKLEKSNSIYVYCRSGARSFQACELMTQFGFENVYNLEGGIIEWSGEIIQTK